MRTGQWRPDCPAGQPETDDAAQALLDRLYHERFSGMHIRRTPRIHHDTDDLEDPHGQA